MLCDFCSQPVQNPWAYPVEGSFGFIANADDPRSPFIDLGASPWAACEPCAEFIEADDYRALAGKHDDPSNAVVFHSLFKVHRKGERYKVTTTRRGINLGTPEGRARFAAAKRAARRAGTTPCS